MHNVSLQTPTARPIIHSGYYTPNDVIPGDLGRFPLIPEDSRCKQQCRHLYPVLVSTFETTTEQVPEKDARSGIYEPRRLLLPEVVLSFAQSERFDLYSCFQNIVKYTRKP